MDKVILVSNTNIREELTILFVIILLLVLTIVCLTIVKKIKDK